ncbi:hypothetical protein D9M69_655080 [compost metagenome]
MDRSLQRRRILLRLGLFEAAFVKAQEIDEAAVEEVRRPSWSQPPKEARHQIDEPRQFLFAQMQLRLRGDQIVDIDGYAVPPDDLARLVAQGLSSRFSPAIGAVGAVLKVFDRVRRTRCDGSGECPLRLLQKIGMDHPLERE